MKFELLILIISYETMPAFSLNLTELWNLNSSYYASWEARVDHIKLEIALFNNKSEEIATSFGALRKQIPNYLGIIAQIVVKNDEWAEMKKYLKELESKGKSITSCQQIFDSELGAFTKEMQDYFTKIVKNQIEDVQQHLETSVQELKAIEVALNNNATKEIEKCEKEKSSCKITKQYEKILNWRFYQNNYMEVELLPSMIQKVVEAFDENIVAPYRKLNIFSRINTCVEKDILSKAK